MKQIYVRYQEEILYTEGSEVKEQAVQTSCELPMSGTI